MNINRATSTQFFNSTTFKVVFRGIIAIVLGFIITRFTVDPIEAYFYDARFRLKPVATASGNAMIVTYDTSTIARYKKVPDVKQYLEVVRYILKANAKTIAFVDHLDKLEGSEQDKKELADLLEANSKSVYQVLDESERAWGVTAPLAAPFSKINIGLAPITKDKSTAKDNVTRRAMVHYRDEFMLHPILASQFNVKAISVNDIRGHFTYYESDQTLIDFLPKGKFPRVKFDEVTSYNPTEFENKIIFIGNDAELETDDYRMTPFDRSNIAMSVTELHANITDSLIRNSGPLQAPIWFDLILTFLICIWTVHVVLAMKPLKGIIVLGTTTVLFLAVAMICSWLFGIWINVTHPLLAIFLCYYFFIPYRLIIENRKSWEYQQKHKLVSEVEELKTNFIGMMSHDLKTPLARIQGMIEVIVKDKTTLSSGQVEAIDTIRKSTEDLVSFISTILNYARLESQGFELHLEAKDINELVKETVRKYEFMAKLKHIQLICELEPLFPLKVDKELIRQAFSNLIENAIKYSPEGSKVLITSEEIDGKVQIQVADQGQGIPAEELENIFLKFYRSKAAKTSTIKGSGLGLYLAKYLIGLHKGNITVESSMGEGSTFTVELPS